MQSFLVGRGSMIFITSCKSIDNHRNLRISFASIRTPPSIIHAMFYNAVLSCNDGPKHVLRATVKRVKFRQIPVLAFAPKGVQNAPPKRERSARPRRSPLLTLWD
jgi:hypothetical protein